MPRTLLALIVVFSLAPALSTVAQTGLEGGARAAGLGGAYCALPAHAAGRANPAAWASLPTRAVTFFAAQPYGLRALRLAAVDAFVPAGWGTATAGIRVFGTEAYRETHAHVGLARGFGLLSARRVHLGLRLRLHHVAIDGYGRAAALAVAGGLLVEVVPGLTAGVEAANLHAPSLAGREELPRTLALGLAYRPAPPMLLLVDVVKDVRFPLSVRAGAEASPGGVLVVRAGAATAPARFAAGAGIRLGTLGADVAAERHEALGWSPAIALNVTW
ncbi:MAG: hypothetical protein R3247_03135 [Rhodothermales bacterium]|nr:hypothetical protein [Rhodothermales bacterium]